MVPGPVRRGLTGRIAEMIGQLAAQSSVGHPAGELVHQPARASDLLRRQAFERILQRLLGQQLGQSVAQLLRRIVLALSGRGRAATTS